MELGERIKAIRVNLGETMEQFGERFDTSKGTVNNWEKGRNAPNKANLKRLADLSDNPREFISLYLTQV
ncbi:TPA: helix-turn-helix transcriptional regulator [Streptococcus suis]|nr:helix-turn-helix transcriptional regulator [Streptococcus suis]